MGGVLQVPGILDRGPPKATCPRDESSSFDRLWADYAGILDRLLHGAETVLIEGKSYQMRDQIVPPRAS